MVVVVVLGVATWYWSLVTTLDVAILIVIWVVVEWWLFTA
jgi:hypothetical protein